LVETILPGCDLTAVLTQGAIAVAWDVWISQNQPGVPKQATVRLRRTNRSGAILATQAFGGAGIDSTAGHEQEWNSSFSDTLPTDGHYVLTVQEVQGSTSTTVWSDTRTFSVVTARAPGPVRDSQSLLRLGVGTGVPRSVESFVLGSLSVDAVESFIIDAPAAAVDLVEPFSILGFASLVSAEPFMLGQTLAVGSAEPFSIQGPNESYFGPGSPASPKMGWRNQSA